MKIVKGAFFSVVYITFTHAQLLPITSASPGHLQSTPTNPLGMMWGRARADLSSLGTHKMRDVGMKMSQRSVDVGMEVGRRGGQVLETMRKQSKIKLSELTNHMTLPMKAIIPCNMQLKVPQLPFPGRGGSTTASTAPPKKKSNNSGFYYGIRDDVFFPQQKESGKKRSDEIDSNGAHDSESTQQPSESNIRSPMREKRENRDNSSSGSLADIMGETLYELREMREDIMALREEMQYMKQEFKRSKELQGRYRDGEYDDSMMEGDEMDTDGYSMNDDRTKMLQRVARQQEFDAIGDEVEKWAHSLIFEEDGEEFGWKEVKCNKMVRKKFNGRGQTSCYLKWMKDARGKHAENPDDHQEFPCVKVFTTLNSPIEDVCEYLAQEPHMMEYNDLVVSYRDLEEISPHSKITWSQCPQILFIKPRDFVTFCHHRWRKDGTQIVVSQACNHKDAPGNDVESDDKACRAYSLRGANFISRDPTDPNKTRMAILAHANPGGGVPSWALKTAINAVAPIEPFKLFQRIDDRVLMFREKREPRPADRADFVQSTRGRSARPAGLSQLGYACFWPNGGGKVGRGPPSAEYQTDNVSIQEEVDVEHHEEQPPHSLET